MEITAQAPTGTELRIQSDRQFDAQEQHDSVLRIQGNKDGSQVFDAAYVEVTSREADCVAKLLRNARQPYPELQDAIAQEVQAAFSSKLTGRDAQQIAHLVTTATQQQVSRWMGGSSSASPEQAGQQVERTAEKFERAAGQKRSAPAYTSGAGGGGQQQSQQGSGRGESQSWSGQGSGQR
jgi:hypothetical protein